LRFRLQPRELVGLEGQGRKPVSVERGMRRSWEWEGMDDEDGKGERRKAEVASVGDGIFGKISGMSSDGFNTVTQV